MVLEGNGEIIVACKKLGPVVDATKLKPKKDTSLTVTEIARRTAPGVVLVVTQEGFGTGFSVGPKLFATNLHGFANFELYLVDADGAREPVRVTDRKGFDGLPTFSPDGRKISWTSNATPKRQSQIFIADWNHEAALKALGIADSRGLAQEDAAAQQVAADARAQATADFSPQDILRHVDYLCRDELAGRRSGPRRPPFGQALRRRHGSRRRRRTRLSQG